MVKKNNVGWWGLVVLLTCLMAGIAQADPGNGNQNDNGNGGNGNHNGWGDGVPAAPEPLTIAMSVLGLAAVGGYIYYRRRKKVIPQKP